MKYMTIEHMKKLDKIKLNKYFNECVDKLEYIDYEYAFEKKKENYLNFVKHVYKIAKERGLDNKKYAFSLMLLWHVEGDSINEDEEFLEVLTSQNIHGHEKSEYFNNRAIEHMKTNKREESNEL